MDWIYYLKDTACQKVISSSQFICKNENWIRAYNWEKSQKCNSSWACFWWKRVWTVIQMNELSSLCSHKLPVAFSLYSLHCHNPIHPSFILPFPFPVFGTLPSQWAALSYLHKICRLSSVSLSSARYFPFSAYFPNRLWIRQALPFLPSPSLDLSCSSSPPLIHYPSNCFKITSSPRGNSLPAFLLCPFVYCLVNSFSITVTPRRSGFGFECAREKRLIRVESREKARQFEENRKMRLPAPPWKIATSKGENQYEKEWGLLYLRSAALTWFEVICRFVLSFCPSVPCVRESREWGCRRCRPSSPPFPSSSQQNIPFSSPIHPVHSRSRRSLTFPRFWRYYQKCRDANKEEEKDFRNSNENERKSILADVLMNCFVSDEFFLKWILKMELILMNIPIFEDSLPAIWTIGVHMFD